jgi:hypothetical protein
VSEPVHFRTDAISVIYFIQDRSTLLIKIGYTAAEPIHRLAQLQVGCPGGLVLLCAADGDREKEISLHKQLASSRERGEWFRPTPEVLSNIWAIAYNFGARDVFNALDLHASQNRGRETPLSRDDIYALVVQVAAGRSLPKT